MFTNMRYVYEVYKAGSFSKAAENLFISQPALSATIKKVEKKVGLPIFDRGRNPIRLTECGKEYIKTAEKIMNLEEEFAGYISDLNNLMTGHLSVGGTYFFTAYIFPDILQKFQEQYPNIELNLIEGHTSQLEERLFSGELDLLMDNYPMDEELYEKIFLTKEHLLLAVPAGFVEDEELRSKSLSRDDIGGNVHMSPDACSVTLKLFEDRPFVLLKAHNDTRERVEKICEHAEISPEIAWNVDQMLTAYHLTEKGMGISFLSDTAVKNLPINKDIYYYKIDDPIAERNVYLFYRKNRYFTRSMSEFIKLASSWMEA